MTHGMRTVVTGRAVLACAVALVAFAAPAAATAQLSTRNITPFPRSTVIVGASWTSPRLGPPHNQSGDILPTIWADDGSQYTLMDDGGTDVPISGGFWRQSLARITGGPWHASFVHVGDPTKPPAATYAQIRTQPKLWSGPLGPYYSSGLVEADHVFFATREYNWNWNVNAPFAGLVGTAYSLDRGAHWTLVTKPFPAPIGNLNWVILGKGGFYADGYVYAIASEREFNASRLIMGRSRPDVADMTDPAKWQWVSGWTTQNGMKWPLFSDSLSSAVPIVSWASHITYPQMAYDSPLHRYLLTFTFSYSSTTPGLWRNGADLVIAEAPHPWGPFAFVAHESWFGPSNGYDPGFPLSWMSSNGRTLWLKWAANFDGCASQLDCSGGYGFNYRRIGLTVAGVAR